MCVTYISNDMVLLFYFSDICPISNKYYMFQAFLRAA